MFSLEERKSQGDRQCAAHEWSLLHVVKRHNATQHCLLLLCDPQCIAVDSPAQPHNSSTHFASRVSSRSRCW